MTATAQQAGVDTWSPCWYVDRDSLAADMLDDLAAVKVARGARLPEKVAGHVIGWNRGAGMLYAEGHPAGAGTLGCPDELPAALDGLVAAMLAAEIPVPNGVRWDAWDGDYALPRSEIQPGFAGIRRLDATVDLAMPSTAEGLAVLAGVAAIARDAPRSKAEVIWAADGSSVETVYLRGHGGKKVLGRWYDKGAESAAAPRGRLLRPEDQRRFVKGTRRHVTELTSSYVRAKFQQRFAPLWRASKGVTVAGPIVLAEKLVALVEAEELSMAQAEQLAGHALLDALAPKGRSGLSRTTRYRRRVAMREHGLVLADGVLQEVEVDLHDVLERALDGAAWGPQG